MAVKVYNKLVRDKIPEIIERDGKKSAVRVLSDEEYLEALDIKLDEELAEYHKDQNVEELADLLEVLYAAAEARGYTTEELEKTRREKAERRGEFHKKIYLETVFEGTNDVRISDEHDIYADDGKPNVVFGKVP